MSRSTSEWRVRLAPWNRFKPFSKYYCWPFPGGTSFEAHLCFLSCVCYAFVLVRVCLFVPCGHLLGKGWPLVSRLWCLTVSLSLSHWYPWSGVILDYIDSWSLHPYFVLRKNAFFTFEHPKRYTLWPYQTVCDTPHYRLQNIINFNKIRYKLYRQIVGISIGTNWAPGKFALSLKVF